MACFTIAWLVRLLVWAAIAAGIWAIATYLLGKIQLGEPFTSAVYILKIVLWVFFAILIIYFCADLITCALGNVPRLRP